MLIDTLNWCKYKQARKAVWYAFMLAQLQWLIQITTVNYTE